MSNEITIVLMWAALVIQYALGFVLVVSLLKAASFKKPRFAHLALLKWKTHTVDDRWLRMARVSRVSQTFKERERLLAGCGYTGDAALYVLLRRAILAGTPLWTILAYGMTKILIAVLPAVSAPLALAAVLLLLLWDLPWLEAVRRTRAVRMTKEIHIVSNQLLYLAGSSLHIHTKLMRCLPYTRTMRGDLQTLLGEWYHDAESALRRLKLRLGTEEGLSFVETIDSLRLHESERYYELLRERIQDYKEKLELAKDSRKESTSYLLFVLAGIPIMYTFQIFIYPWVKEGQLLFQSLN
ncbi:hypothetical protein [Paenibacillus sacheonensis]|uniref:Type II secretion system protein GspF domain-containing protein n=1 Tax=Paenibacillus sacheonensis TaxID=742054 RepID=A0A7X4YP95_9BACL|nr:hypothetical protein [Paenibacillus sacheonensis]MBM7565273.1 hypothetical protein [Paenibacillus sacheonensis]NBC69955.1 hypothetical protein [Paenibacillus sacheonensis]